MRFDCSAIGTACALFLTAIGAATTSGANAEAGGAFRRTAIPQLQSVTRLAQMTLQAKVRAPLGAASSHAAAPVTECAAEYHKAVSEIGAGFAARLALANRLVREADAELPGRWLFSGKSAFTMPSTAAAWSEDKLACVEPFSKGTRARCKSWEVQHVAQLADEPASTLPTGEDLRVLRSLADFVKSRGAVPELGKNGRHTWVTQRVATDLKAYMDQPVHPALCSGAMEILDFYVNHLDGFRKQLKAVADLDAKARELAWARVVAATAAASPSPTAEGSSAPVSAAGITVNTYPEMILETAAVLLPAEQIAHIKAEATALAMLTRAAEAMSMDAIREQPLVLRDIVTAAFRMIEGGIYAEIQLGRYRELEAALFGTIEQIREAHKTACTCGD